MHSSIKSTVVNKILIGLSTSILFASSLSAIASVTYYKSIGASGEVRYTQFPPTGAEYEEITMRSDGRVDEPGQMAGRTRANQTDPKIDSTRMLQERRMQRQNMQKKMRQCQSLRNNLTNLNIGGKVYVVKNGQKIYLNKSQAEMKRNEITQAIAQHCNAQSI